MWKRKRNYEKILDQRTNALPEFAQEYIAYKKTMGCADSSIYEYLYRIEKFLKYCSDDPKTLLPKDINAQKKCEYIKTFDLSTRGKYTHAVSTENLLNEFLDFVFTNYSFDFIEDDQFHSLPTLDEAIERRDPKLKNGDAAAYRIPRVQAYRRFSAEDFERVFCSLAFQGNGEDVMKQRVIFSLLMTSGIDLYLLSNLRTDDYDKDKKTIIIRRRDAVRELLLADIACTIVNRYIRYGYSGLQYLLLTSAGNLYKPAVRERIIKKQSNNIGWEDMNSAQLRSPMYRLLRENKNTAFAQRALEYACLYSEEGDDDGKDEYLYGVRALNECLKDINPDRCYYSVI